MGLYYKSTRNSNLKVTASEAILKGLAPHGGLFVPSELPKLDVSMSDLKGKTYQEIAYLVMKQFLTDFTEEELKAFDLKSILGAPCLIQIIHNVTIPRQYGQ